MADLGKIAVSELNTFYAYRTPKNLLNLGTVSNGYVLDSSSGVKSANASYFCTDYIPVTPGQIIVFSRITAGVTRGTFQARHIAAYDIGKTFISQAAGVAQNVATYTVPAGVKYIIVSTYPSYLPYFIQIEATKDGNYTPYAGYFTPGWSSIGTNIRQLAGLKMTVGGDSITYGNQLGSNWAQIIADANNMTLENLAINGSTVAGGVAGVRHICEDITYASTNSNIVLVSGGYNDLQKNVPLGTLLTTYSGDVLDPTTFYGALETIFRSLLSTNPEAKIGYVITHKTSACETANGLGLKFTDYMNAIIATCQKYGVPYKNLYYEAGLKLYLDDNVVGKYTQAGQGNIHPSFLGYQLFYVPKILAFMKSL